MGLSSTEAEDMALIHVAREGLYLQQVEMGVDHGGLGVLLLCAIQSSMKIAQNPIFHKRSKLIAITYLFIRVKVESGGMEF